MGFCPKGKTYVSQFVKYLMLFGTFTHWLLGLGMVAVGAYAFIEKNKYFYQAIEDVYDVIFDLSIILIVFGGIMFVLNIFGFAGTLRENTCLLRTFVYILVGIVLIEVICGILCLAFKQKVIDVLSSTLKHVYIQDYQNDLEGIMDFFQETWKCCGITTYLDYNQNEYFNCTGVAVAPSVSLQCAVPYSCCINPEEFSPGLKNFFCGGGALLEIEDNKAVEKIYTAGCVTTLVELADENLPIIGGVCIAVSIPQLMGIFLGNLLVGQIRNQWVKYNREMAAKRAAERRYHNHGYDKY